MAGLFIKHYLSERFLICFFAETVKSIKLCRQMVLLLSKDDRCRLYLMRLLVEGTLKKVAEAEGKDFGKVNHTSSINFS